MTIDEVTLMAFADGMLSPQEASRVAAHVAGDPALADQLSRMTALKQALAAAYQGPMQAPVPDRLLAALDSNAIAEIINFPRQAEQQPTSVVSKPRWQRIGVPMALAASIMAAVIVVPKFMRDRDTILQLHQGQLVATAALAKALTATPSTTTVQVNAQTQLTPELSFAAADGTFCRQFNLKTQPRNSDGIACLRGGDWRVEVLAASHGATPGRDEYKLAARQDRPVIDVVVHRLGGSEPFDAKAEAALIAKGWAQR